jgi:DNA-binding SARP family transcriptional activator
MQGLSLKVLGPLSFECRNPPRSTALPVKGHALIVYLAMQGGAVPRAKLADLLWPYQDSYGARHSLRNCLLVIRRQFGSDSIAGNFHNCWVQASTDAHDFKSLAVSNNGHDLRRALDLYSAEFLLDFPALKSEVWEEWLAAQREALGCLARTTAIKLATLASADGDHVVAIAAARRAVELDPLDDDAHRGLIATLAAAGQPASAERAYVAYKRMLRREFGVIPGHQMQAMMASVRASAPQVPQDLRAECRALATRANYALAGVNGARPGKQLFAEMAALLEMIGEEHSHKLAAVA